MAQEQRSHLRRNALCLGLDYLFFGLAVVFISNTTVLPTLIRTLTDSTVLIGVISTIGAGAWLLPQIFSANLVSGRERMKPFILRSAFVGRLGILIVGLVIMLTGATNPSLTLAAFAVLYIFFWVTDGIASLAWVELLAKAIPATQRGRLIGFAQAAYGALAVGIGWLIKYLLGPESSAGFPLNYSLLFYGAGLALMVSLAAIAVIREPLGHKSPRETSWREYLPKVWSILRTDPSFARAVSGRLLVGFGSMAYAFYILFGIENLGLSPASVGVFTAAQTIGTAAGGFLLGYCNDRRGSVAVIRIIILVSLTIPTTALAVSFVGGALGPALMYVYALIFILLGVLNSSFFMLGFMSYIVESAPVAQRPVYVGLGNTLNALILIAPLLGGWILSVSTYQVLFLVAAICPALAFIPAWNLVDPGSGVNVIAPNMNWHDVPIYDYLKRLKGVGENISDYKTIWYYY